jgi:hypothetical protein
VSRSAPWSALPAAAFFVILVTLAFPAGWPRYGSDGGDLQSSLGEMESNMISGAAFHRKVEEPAPPETASFCGGCHGYPPHTGEGAGAAFLNHHATVFDCLVCHWAKVSGGQPDLVWDRLPLEGGDTGEEGDATLFLRLADPLEEEKREVAALRGNVIGHQVCFDRGPACGDCHREGRLGTYSRPGMSVGEEARLEALPAIFLLAKGDKWYFPQRQ